MEEKIKSKNKKQIVKILLFVVLIVFVMFLILTLRKFIIFSQIENISKDKVNSTNYYVERILITGDSTTIMKSYNKDNNFLLENRTISTSNNEETKLIIYNKDNEKIAIIQSGETKIAFINSETMLGETKVHTFETKEIPIWQKILLAAISRITSEECNRKECYLLEPAKGWKLWIDKETGLVVREINGSTIQDSYYKFDEVKDEDVIKPDISDCQIR